MSALRLPNISFGAVSAIVTSVGLITGFQAAGISKSTILAGLLIVGIADNLTDSLSIHVYQESENLDGARAFRATLVNFATRLLIALTFSLLVLTLSGTGAILASIVWGALLLSTVTWLVARSRNVNTFYEITKHIAVAGLVIVASRAIGELVSMYIQ